MEDKLPLVDVVDYASRLWISEADVETIVIGERDLCQPYLDRANTRIAGLLAINEQHQKLNGELRVKLAEAEQDKYCPEDCNHLCLTISPILDYKCYATHLDALLDTGHRLEHSGGKKLRRPDCPLESEPPKEG